MAEKNEILDQIKEKVLNADSILVALSRDPSVDEMAAAIGLTMMLDNSGKHATAIYSGQTPNALEFLRPEKTFETDTNSLQDFIIALNKDKADHLRYKVEGDYVRVYITPYKTQITEKDLEFSHGDFNVDLVIALNIDMAEHLDAALAEYGRIVHDATAINITTGQPGKFAEVQWSDPKKSSVSEMLVILASHIKGLKIEREVATAFLTGIIAATERFSNNKTSPETMTVAAELMKVGADQKLITDNMQLSGMIGDKPESTGGGGALEVVHKDGDDKVDGAERGVKLEPEGEKKTEEAKPEGETEEKVAEEKSAELPDLSELANLSGGDVVLPDEVKKEPITEEQLDKDIQSATEQLEQLIKPAGEDPAMEQLRQVANDVKPPEFQPGQNPAEVIAPKMEEKEANDIPEMNFGAGTSAPEGMMNGAPAPVSGAPVTGPGAPVEEPKKDEMPVMGLDDIQLPPPPAPPAMGNTLAPDVPTPAPAPEPEITPMSVPGSGQMSVGNETPTLPQIQIKSSPTLGEDAPTEGAASDPGEFKIPGA